MGLTELWPYVALFLNAFVAASLLPAVSEATLVTMIATGMGHPGGLFAVATLGNVLGSLLNWVMGTVLLRYRNHRWFPFSDRQIDRGRRLFARYGWPSLLFAWLPVIGDPLTLAAGMFGTRLRLFLPLVIVGKSARYAFLVWGLQFLS